MSTSATSNDTTTQSIILANKSKKIVASADSKESSDQAVIKSAIAKPSQSVLLAAASRLAAMKKNRSVAKKVPETKFLALLERLDSLAFNDQRSFEKKTLIRFEVSSATGLARLYRQIGGFVLTCWKPLTKKTHVRHGVERWVDAQGRTVRLRTFQNGRQIGAEQIFVYPRLEIKDKEGTLVYSCTYSNGVKHGVERIYECVPTKENGFKMGPTMRTLQYCNGMLHGEERHESLSSSLPLKEATWVRGYLHGPCIFYYKNGKESMRCLYSGGKKHGQMVKKNRQGKEKNVVYYANGLKHGKEMLVRKGKVVQMQWQCGTRVCEETGLPFEWN